MSAEPKRYEIGNMVYVEAPEFDALEARHARVREAAEAARKMIVALCLQTKDPDLRHELQKVERVIYEALNGKVRTAGSDFLETP